MKNKNKRLLQMVGGGPLCSEGKRVGYCWYDLHKGYLTKKLMDEHECLKKKCFFFEKFNDAPYWKYRNDIKKKREERRALADERSGKCKAILDRFRVLCKSFEGFAVADVAYDEKSDTFRVRYVALKFVDLGKVIKKVEKEFGVKIYAYPVRNGYEMKKMTIEKLSKSREER